MSIGTAELANLFAGGEDFYEAGGHRVRGLIAMSLGRYQVTLHQVPEVAQGKWAPLKDTRFRSTTLQVEGIRSIHELKGFVHDLSTLLSLATMSPVRPIGWSFKEQGQRIGVPYPGTYFRPTIETMDGEEVRRFLEYTWAEFQVQKKGRQLHELIEYVVLADRPDQPIEIQLLLIFVALENLKATYARSQNMVFRNGAFHSASGTRYGFKSLLTEALQAVGLRRGLKSIVDLRNEIVHNGLSEKHPEDLMTAYSRSQDVTRMYLLRLLRFRGSYLTHASAGRRAVFIARRKL